MAAGGAADGRGAGAGRERVRWRWDLAAIGAGTLVLLTVVALLVRADGRIRAGRADDVLAASLARAEAAGAATMAPRAWQAACAAAGQASAASVAESARGPFTGSYVRVLASLEAALEAARRAEEGAGQVRTGLDRAVGSDGSGFRSRSLAEVRAVIQTAHRSLERARDLAGRLSHWPHQPRDFRKDLEMMLANLDSPERSLALAEQALERGENGAAKDNAQFVASTAARLITDLESARVKLTCRT